jgi:hypothetical protein
VEVPAEEVKAVPAIGEFDQPALVRVQPHPQSWRGFPDQAKGRLRPPPRAAEQHTIVGVAKPLPDRLDHAPVRHPPLDRRDQPDMVDRAEKVGDVEFGYPPIAAAGHGLRRDMSGSALPLFL